MRKFVTSQGNEALVRPIENGKYRVRIKDCNGTVIVSEVVDNESDVGGILNRHGEFWVEKNI